MQLEVAHVRRIYLVTINMPTPELVGNTTNGLKIAFPSFGIDKRKVGHGYSDSAKRYATDVSTVPLRDSGRWRTQDTQSATQLLVLAPCGDLGPNHEALRIQDAGGNWQQGAAGSHIERPTGVEIRFFRV